jgi:DNA-binding SARP family transcriptional activator
MGHVVCAPVHVALLGPLEVTSEEGPVVLGAPKERAVLEMLALRAGRPVPAEALYDGLWGEAAPPSAAKALQTYVSHLRRLLPAGCLLTNSGGYLLQVNPGSVDAARFEGAVHEAARRQEAGERAGAALLLREALALWRGRPCPELTEHTWATAEVARLEELHREAEEELAEVRLALGEHAGLVGELEAAVAAEPLRERRWAQLMLAYYRSGRQADALRAFARLRSTLAEELGISPSASSWPWNKRCCCSPPSWTRAPSSLVRPRRAPPREAAPALCPGPPTASWAGPRKWPK